MDTQAQAEIPGPDDQLQRNVRSIMQLEAKALHSRSWSERIAERATAGAGSPPFIIMHLLWFGSWIVLNSGAIQGVKPFDTFPFSFLTLVVSLEAIFLTLLVLISQKRLMRDADKRRHLDLQVNMLAEQESTETLRIVRLIGGQLGVQDMLPDEVQTELEERTNVARLAKRIETNLPG